MFCVICSSAFCQGKDQDSVLLSLDSLISLNEYALYVKNNGNLSEAKLLYPTILNGIEARFGKETQAYFDVSTNYIRLLNELGDVTKSYKLLDELYTIYHKGNVEIDEESYLLFLYARAECNLYDGKHEEALKLFKKIEDSYDLRDRNRDRIYANTLSGIAECYELMADYVQSDLYFRKAILFYGRNIDADQMINVYNNYMEMSLRADSVCLARSIWENTEGILHDSINDIVEYISYFNYFRICTAEKSPINNQYIVKSLKIYERLLDDILSDLNEAELIYFARRKFKNFQHTLKSMLNTNSQEIIDLLYRCHYKSKDIVRLYYLPVPANESNSPLNPSSDLLQINFFEYELDSLSYQYGFFVSGNDKISLHYIEEIFTYSEGFDVAKVQEIWENIAMEFNEQEEVLVSPIGRLHQFNFQLYDDSQSTKFYVGAIGFKEESIKDTISILAIGGLHYSSRHSALYRAESENLNRADDAYYFLPFTEREINDIVSYSSTENTSVSILDRSDAIEPVVKKYLMENKYDVIHFATHGFFKNTSHSQFQFDSGFENSGLALSYAGEDSGDENQYDNLLHGYEINNLYADRLNTANLVFMSSCKSGLSNVAFGDNLYGIQEAFRRSGVQNIISTSDVVPDVVSYKFAKSFYEEWLSGDSSIYEAYRVALLAVYNQYGLIESSKFKLIGNGDTVIRKSHSRSGSKIIVCIVILVVISFLYYLILSPKNSK